MYICNDECGWGGSYPGGSCPWCGAGVSEIRIEIHTDYEDEDDYEEEED